MNTNKEIVFGQLKLELSRHRIKTVADAANVDYSTLYLWMSGKVKSPRIDTLCKVANSIGFNIEIKLVRRK